mmetsp:Transcript_5655/g.8450  ORF Transcript_5655/g.8450 Transcript_5655/m.8450 type:complete len:2169 (-) Transcript_5655:99-6605(-)
MHRFHKALLALATLLSSSSTSFQAFGQVTSIFGAGDDRVEVTVTASSSSSRFLANDQFTLGGPNPYGWTVESDVSNEANLAFDLGKMYEEEDSNKQKNIYENGLRPNQAVTLKSLGKDTSSVNENPLFSFYTYSLMRVGGEEGEEVARYFDDAPVEEYANTVVNDLFGVESSTSFVLGIEKEAVTILGLWMNCYNYMSEIVRLCRDKEDNAKMLESLDKAIALWIGHLQVYGDNARGTMLYNLAERAGFNFAQDHGEAPANAELMKLWLSIKEEIKKDTCQNDDGHEFLYRKILKVAGQMNIPLVQNFIHYIMTGAENKLIELYTVAIFPQIISCDLSFNDYFYDLLRDLALKPKDQINLTVALSNLQKMYNCLGVSCAQIGAHAGGISCVDEEIDPIASIVGYLPTSNVASFIKFDRDINQIQILLSEGNIDSAYDLYKFGRNAVEHDSNPHFSLRSMAKHLPFTDTSDDPRRLYAMYAKLYGGTDFADTEISNIFKQAKHKEYAEYAIPLLMQIIVAPQYAVRSFFEAYDICESDRVQAEKLWDLGVAALTGSIEGESAEGNGENGKSWYALAEEQCRLFHCGDGDFSNPVYRQKMMDNIKFGRDFIRSGRCSALHNKLVLMESLLITPLLQGTLYHTYKSAKESNETLEKRKNFARGFAYGTAIMPFLYIANKEDAQIVENALSFDESHTLTDDVMVKVWEAILLSLERLGVECQHIGRDTLGVFDKQNNDMSFCDISNRITQFPTSSPFPTAERRPSASPSPSAAPSTEAQLLYTEIDGTFKAKYNFTDPDATNKARIALDVKEIASLRGDIESEIQEAIEIYNQTKHSISSLRELGRHDEDLVSEDAMYNFYRSAFRESDLFNSSLDSDSDHGSMVDFYADTIVTDALVNAQDVELATEAIVVMTIFMKVTHSLSSAIMKCKSNNVEDAAGLEIDTALAYYIGVGQRVGRNDGFLFYSFAQRSSMLFGTIHEASKESHANTEIMQLFVESKDMTKYCSDSSKYIELRKNVGSIIRQMNVPLVQYFLYLLEQNAHKTKQTNYLELLGLAVLPQIKTCMPTAYDFLSKRITYDELKLDPAEVDKLVSTFTSTYSCFGVTCSQIHGGNDASCSTTSYQDNMYAGFRATTDVSKNAIMDRDVLKIHALMSEKAWNSALEYFELGHIIGYNQYDTSLKELANELDDSTNPNPYSELYMHKLTGLVTGVIEGETINGNPAFNSANHNRAEVVFKTMQTMLFVQAAMRSIFSAVDNCGEKKFQEWDRAAAYLIGSIEGPDFGGNPGNSGVSIYGLAKTMCGDFNVCTTSKDADVNKYLLAALSKGRDLISGESCKELKDYTESRIIPLILVPLIQATIKFVDENVPEQKFVMGQAMYPFLLKVNSTAAVNIRDLTRMSQVDAGNEIMEEFSYVLRELGVDCSDVGVYQLSNASLGTTDMCSFNSTKHGQSYSLSDGLYVTSTYVEDSAKIAEDVSFIREELEAGDFESAKKYYIDGLFSEIYDSTGRRSGRRSLQKFSTMTTLDMLSEPVFNLYQYTLQDVDGFQNDVRTYADVVTSSFFDAGNNMFTGGANTKTLAIESAIALNLWSMIVHKLYETIKKCQENDFNSSSEGVHNIDQAVAFWIGSSQQTGNEKKGHLLYRLTEEGGKHFGTDSHDNQSRANKYILRLFKEAAMQLMFQGACYNENSIMISELRFIVNKLVAQMTVPLIQHLIYNLRENNKGRVKIYAHAVLPHIAPCNKSTFEYLKKKLIVEESYGSEVDEIIKAIQSTYSCLDLKCKDIGQLNGVPQCNEREELQSFAGYTPATDVREYLDMDIDIRYIEIMLTMKNRDAAKDIYQHGKHAIVMRDGRKEPLKLRDLAISTNRDIVPSFDKFSKYFEDTSNYADKLVMRALQDHTEGSQEQNTALVVNALQYQVSYMAALEKIYRAIAGCESSSQAQFVQAQEDWDIAAAYIIGSMQKKVDSPEQNDGYLLYGLGFDLCSEFNKCKPQGLAAAIDLDLLDSLYAGSFMLGKGSCIAVRNQAIKIEKELQIPLIQGTLYAAFTMDNFHKMGNAVVMGNKIFASGYVYSNAILPYIDAIDADASKVIQECMAFDFRTSTFRYRTPKRHEKIFDAISKVVDSLGISCNDIGYMTTAKKGVCTVPQSSGNIWKMNSWKYSTILLSITFIVLW